MDNLTDQDVQAQLETAANAPDKEEAPHPLVNAQMTPIQVAQLPPPARTNPPTFIDSMVAHADNFVSHYGVDMRSERAAASGLIQGGVNAVDSAKSFMEQSGKGLAMAEDPAHAEDAAAGADPITPMYNDARSAVLDFRDSLALKDPSIPESLKEGAWQLVPSFLMFSRVMGSIGGLAKLGTEGGFAAKAGGALARFVPADTANSAIMLGPHDPRLADTLSLLRTAEGHFTGVLGQLDNGTGNLLSHYVDFLTNRNETEAEGRFKNVLDSYGAAAALTGVLHSAGTVFKQGWRALHTMASAGMEKMSDIPKPALRPEVATAAEK